MRRPYLWHYKLILLINLIVLLWMTQLHCIVFWYIKGIYLLNSNNWYTNKFFGNPFSPHIYYEKFQMYRNVESEPLFSYCVYSSIVKILLHVPHHKSIPQSTINSSELASKLLISILHSPKCFSMHVSNQRSIFLWQFLHKTYIMSH